MSLLTELDAFFTDHRDCGELEAGVDDPLVWIVCACGATLERARAPHIGPVINGMRRRLCR